MEEQNFDDLLPVNTEESKINDSTQIPSNKESLTTEDAVNQTISPEIVKNEQKFDSISDNSNSIPPTILSSDKKKKKSLWVVILTSLIIFFIFGALAGAYFGYINIPFLFQPPKLENVLAKLSAFDSAEYVLLVGVDIRDKQADTTEIIKLFDESNSATESFLDISNMMFEQLSIEMMISHLYKLDNNSQSGRSRIDFDIATDTLSLKAGGEVIIANNQLYGIFDKVPPILSSYLGGIGNQWILLSEDGFSQADANAVLQYKRDLEKDKVNYIDLLKQNMDGMREVLVLTAEGVRTGALPIREVKRGVNGTGDSVWRYSLTINPIEMIQLQNEMVDNRALLFPDKDKFSVLNSKWLIDENNEDVDYDLLEALVRATQIIVVVNKETNEFESLEIITKFALEDGQIAELDGKEFVIQTMINNNQVDESVVIEAPSEYITMTEAMTQLSLESAEEKILKQQHYNIEDIRTSLERFKEINGEYPQKLADLIGFEFIPKTYLNVENRDSYVKVVVGIPNDIFSEQPFFYEVNENGDYRLSYYMEIPEIQPYYIQGKYINGVNVATPDNLSVEAGPVCGDGICSFGESGCDIDCRPDRVDSDNDGLSDEEEKELGTDPNNPDTDGDGLTDWEEVEVYGTNPLNPDTDGDGYTDKQEVDAGYDPLNAPTN